MSSGMSISMCSGSGASPLDWVARVGLLIVLALGASPLDWVVGLGSLIRVSGEYTGIPGCLVQAPWTTLIFLLLIIRVYCCHGLGCHMKC